jgi:aminoglycoside phosphotransferase (APT) family kinase protein
VDALGSQVEAPAVLAAWDEALDAPVWTGPPTWFHGDLSPGNLLCRDDRLAAVIDFGSLGVGDPAVDLIVAWNLLPASARPGFRDAVDVDDATWARGRGWALSIALIQLPYYEHTNPGLTVVARRTVAEVLADR